MTEDNFSSSVIIDYGANIGKRDGAVMRALAFKPFRVNGAISALV